MVGRRQLWPTSAGLDAARLCPKGAEALQLRPGCIPPRGAWIAPSRGADSAFVGPLAGLYQPDGTLCRPAARRRALRTAGGTMHQPCTVSRVGCLVRSGQTDKFPRRRRIAGASLMRRRATRFAADPCLVKPRLGPWPLCLGKFGVTLMQPVADLFRGVGAAPTFASGHDHPGRRDACHACQPEHLPPLHRPRL